MNKDDLILISVDDHIAEPADMFDAHVPAKYKDRAPRVVLEPDGVQQWYYGEVRGRNMGLNAVAGKPREMYNIDASRYDEMRPGCFNVDERVRDMNAGGQLAGLNFPNFTGFSGQVLNQGPDREVNLVMIKAYNDWHVDEWCGAYPGRFIPCGILPLFDVAEAAKEVKRLADKGCHAVTFSENPEALQMPSIHTKYWYPLFEAACENKTVLCTHVGSASRSPQVSTDAPPSVQMTASSMMSMFTFTELIWAEFWADFPQLKFSLTEGDVGWIPYFLWRAEHVYNRHSGWTLATFPPGYSGPTDVFKRHFYTCFISDKVGVHKHGVVQRGHAVLGVRLPALRQQLAVRAGGHHRHHGPPRRPGHRQDHPRKRHGRVLIRPLPTHPEGTGEGRPAARAGHRCRRRHPRRPPSQPARPGRVDPDDAVRPAGRSGRARDGRGGRHRRTRHHPG